MMRSKRSATEPVGASARHDAAGVVVDRCDDAINTSGDSTDMGPLPQIWADLAQRDTRIYSGVRLHQKSEGSRAAGILFAMILSARSYGGVTAERASRHPACGAAGGGPGPLRRRRCARGVQTCGVFTRATQRPIFLRALHRFRRTARSHGPGIRPPPGWRQSAPPPMVRFRMSARRSAPPLLRRSVFLTADPRRGQLLLRSHTSDVMQRARVDSTRAIANAMTAMLTDTATTGPASRLDTEMASFALVSGAMEVIAGWLRGDFATDQDHVADTVAGLLLAIPDIAAALPAVSAKQHSTAPVTEPLGGGHQR